MPERLDRLLSRLGYGSRREVRAWLRAGRITLDGHPLQRAEQKVDAARVRLDGEPLDHPQGLHLIYHKPLGQVCSRKEAGELVYHAFPTRWLRRRPALSSVGRLDKDTSGLLLFTDDGDLHHRLSHPRQGIGKTYAVLLERPLAMDDAERLRAGGLLLAGDSRPCRPAGVHVLDARNLHLTLHEGRYHQVRRMFAALGNHVQALTRIAIGRLQLEDMGLRPGQWLEVEADALWSMVQGGTDGV